MEATSPPVGPVLVDELKRQAREAGYLVWTMPKAEAWLYLTYALGIVLGYSLAVRS